MSLSDCDALSKSLLLQDAINNEKKAANVTRFVFHVNT